MFHFNIKIAQQRKIVEIYCRKVESTEEMANFSDYPGGFIP